MNSNPTPAPLSYKDAGVDIDAGNTLVSRIKSLVAGTYGKGVLSDIGGFGGLFKLDTEACAEPVLVSGTDGVGTKVAIAQAMGIYHTVGWDLIGMLVDDLVVTGAEPLFVTDYIACGKVHPERIAAIVDGIARGCSAAGAALLGGETAGHPGLRHPDEWGIAGGITGVVEREKRIGPDRVRAGHFARADHARLIQMGGDRSRPAMRAGQARGELDFTQGRRSAIHRTRAQNHALWRGGDCHGV